MYHYSFCSGGYKIFHLFVWEPTEVSGINKNGWVSQKLTAVFLKRYISKQAKDSFYVFVMQHSATMILKFYPCVSRSLLSVSPLSKKSQIQCCKEDQGHAMKAFST